MRSSSKTWNRGIATGVVGVLLLVLLAACAPATAPTATPTKAAPAVSPSAAPKVEATKPAAQPASTPAAVAPKPTGAPIKIGYLTPLTGPVGPNGFLESAAIALAEEDIAKAGNINGNPIQLIRYDSPFDPKQAVTLMRKLALEDKAFAILGPYSSGEMDVAAPLANELQIATIGMKTSKPGFSEAYRPWEFRVTITDDLFTPAIIAAFKKAHPTVKKVVLVGDTKESVTEAMFKEVFPKFLKEAGYEIVGQIPYDSGTTDFSAIVTKIKSMNPEGIAFTATPKGNPPGFAKELVAQQVKLPVMASHHFVPGNLVFQVGKEVEGWIAATYYDWTIPDPKVQDLVKRWQVKADADSNIPKPAQLTHEANSYDVVIMLADILRKANITAETPLQDARTKIRDGFAKLGPYTGLSGTTKGMQPNGDALFVPIPVIAKNGRWEVYK